ncbi:hypothetical protein J7438_05230 [Thalassotalea sp. G20_0]|uniref:hypothetical protein n=1 Tax=Thalassotalea sp. G20_0 TaxID=2821093 RepID=UPI001ADA3621|nr:hypothetical protein [Thalassotalea sp. G20_0]MBO9493489.1 hypothetical protein [Thalassotalea sp. G20_0]
MTPNCTTNNRPVMPGNTDATTQSPDNLARCHGKDHLLPNLMHVAASVFVGTWTVFVNRVVIAKLNEPGHDFLEDHLTFAEFQEYRELTPHSSLFLSQLAVTSTAIYLASGGLCKLCGGCKSIYDRACTYFSAPDATANQPAGDCD